MPSSVWCAACQGTSTNAADITQIDQLLQIAENMVCADAGNTVVEKRPEHDGRAVIWQITARHSTSEHLSKRSAFLQK